MKKTDHPATDNWCIRRRWMKVILTWAILNVQYLIFFGTDTAINQNALIALLGVITGISGSYIFGAVWDDNGKRRYRSNQTNEGEGE